MTQRVCDAFEPTAILDIAFGIRVILVGRFVLHGAAGAVNLGHLTAAIRVRRRPLVVGVLGNVAERNVVVAAYDRRFLQIPESRILGCSDLVWMNLRRTIAASDRGLADDCRLAEVVVLVGDLATILRAAGRICAALRPAQDVSLAVVRHVGARPDAVDDIGDV